MTSERTEKPIERYMLVSIVLSNANTVPGEFFVEFEYDPKRIDGLSSLSVIHLITHLQTLIGHAAHLLANKAILYEYSKKPVAASVADHDE